MTFNPFTLSNKRILVTGASSGLGKAIAIECARMGATIAISGRDETRLLETFSLLNGEGHSMHIADLNEDEELSGLVAQLPELDGIVHCAGIIYSLPFQFTTDQKMNDIFSINVIRPSLLTASLVKGKKIKKGGSIVWLSSINGEKCSSPGHSLYSSTKSAINGLVKGMAIDLAKKNIRVNSINPGQVKTNLFREGIITEEQIEIEKKKYPLNRLGEPHEIAYAAIYLLSDASQWITGTHLIIDGGYTLL